jgi:lipopolysaccharide transport system ATP-binding protein
MLGVIGPNGAGKSTLLRLLAGVMRPSEGEVVVRGQIGGLLQLGVGFHPDLSGRENVFTNGIVAGLTSQEVAQRFDSIVRFAELENFIDNPLRTYSTGMRMRLGFATAAHTDADVLLIDEVLTVGDLAFQQKCLERIERYKSDGCAVVFVTHSLDEVLEHCERTLWLRGGEVAALGSSDVVIDQYRSEMSDETRRRTPPAIERSDPAKDALILNENRFGSLEMEIERVRILDSAGSETEEVHGGSAVSVEISYHAPEPIASPIFSVSISNQNDVHCCDISTESSGLLLPILHGRGRMVLHLERIDLGAGIHFINVGVHERSWAYAYDFHWHVYRLRLLSERREPAVMSPPRHWELQADVPPRHPD